MAVAVFQRVEHLAGQVDRLLDGELAGTQQFGERDAVHVLHDEVGLRIAAGEPLADVVDGGDRRVVQRRHGMRLALEPLPRGGVVRQLLGEELDGDRSPQSVVHRPVDRAHPAAAQLADEFVAAVEDEGPPRFRQHVASPAARAGSADPRGRPDGVATARRRRTAWFTGSSIAT